MSALVVGLLGAESTGKTTLSAELAAALTRAGHRVTVVAEYLREFCETEGRVPRRDEQADIAAEQTLRIEAAASDTDIVIADTTALMIAVYSDFVFADTSLYQSAVQDHRRCDVTLLTALDLPWTADGLQREGPHVQRPIDALIRNVLQRGGVDHSVVFGSDSLRTAAALRVVERALSPVEASASPRWQWCCDHCGDAACERLSVLGPTPPQLIADDPGI